MRAFSTSAFSNSNMGWLSAEDPFSHNQNYFNKESVYSSEYNSFPHQFSSPQPQVEVERFTVNPSLDPTMIKKISHNASERDRRKKINSMIDSLRSLLPVSDHMKKMSFPATISQVVKYIPELQQQVEGLSEKKEELLSRISQQGVAMNRESQRNIPHHHNSEFTVSNSWLNDSEVAIHISSYEAHQAPLSEILLYLENNGHFLLNASSSETIEGRVFYYLHFQVEKAHRLDSDILTQKLLSIYEKKQRIFSSNMCLVRIKRSSLL